jgi:hypothetical protein
MKKFIFLFATIFLTGIVMAGCCIDPLSGLCSPNTNTAFCIQGGGQYSTETCSGLSVCDIGCCSLSAGNVYTSSADCSIRALIAGENPQWGSSIDSSSCYAANPGTGITPGTVAVVNPLLGADCTETVSGSEVTRKSGDEWCAGDARNYTGATVVNYHITTTTGAGFGFAVNIETGNWSPESTALGPDGTTLIPFSPNELLRHGGTILTILTDEMIDSEYCGHRGPEIHGEKKNFTTGNGTMTKKEVYEDGYQPEVEAILRSNWGALNNLGITGEISTMRVEPLESTIDPNSVGSIAIKKFCLNGKIQEVACTGMREDICSEGNCIKNPYQQCFNVPNKDLCNPAHCTWFDPIEHPAYSNVKGGVGNVLNCSAQGTSTSCIVAVYGGSVPYTFCVNGTHVTRTVRGGTTTYPSTLTASEYRRGLRADGYTIQSTYNTGATLTVENKKPLIDLNLSRCLPKISPGSPGYCSSSGDKKISLKMQRTKWTHGGHKDDDAGYWYVVSGSAEGTIVNIGQGNYGHAGLFSLDSAAWTEAIAGNIWHNSIGMFQGYDGDSKADDILFEEIKLGRWGIPPQVIIEIMEEECRLAGDCGNSTNWLGEKGLETGIANYEFTSTSSNVNHRVFTFNYTCNPYKPVFDSARCQECETILGKACNEYSCTSIGQNCEAIPKGGRTYCRSSDDLTPPVISHTIDPTGDIDPFSPIKITINTDEVSHCRFDLNGPVNAAPGANPDSIFESMSAEVDVNWSTTHEMTLSLPGGIPPTEIIRNHPILEGGGNYIVYVRCEDVRGKFDIAPYTISFMVKPDPDYVAPFIRSFSPITGTAVPFGTTSKAVTIKVNEPAECKWDQVDNEYNQMGNSFSCQTGFTAERALTGFPCTATFTGIIQSPSELTSYYVRCKDQPGLVENSIYHRNANTAGQRYILRGSAELLITSKAPQGSLTLGTQNNIDLTVSTGGGSDGGVANCKFKQSGSSNWQFFTDTDSTSHRTALTDITAGNYNVALSCLDNGGNVATDTLNFIVTIDTTGPRIVRIYSDQGRLKVITREPSNCKYSFTDGGCSLSWFDNVATPLTTNDQISHTTPLVLGKTYYIDCYDSFDNTDHQCAESAIVI